MSSTNPLLDTYREYHPPQLPPGWSKDIGIEGKPKYTHRDGRVTRVHPSVFKTFDELNALTPEQLLTIEPYQIDNTKIYTKTGQEQRILSTIPTPFPTDNKSKMIITLILTSVESYNIIDNIIENFTRKDKINILSQKKTQCTEQLVSLYHDIVYPPAVYPPPPPPAVYDPAVVRLPSPPTRNPKAGSRRKNRKTGKKISAKRRKHRRTHRRR